MKLSKSFLQISTWWCLTTICLGIIGVARISAQQTTTATFESGIVINSNYLHEGLDQFLNVTTGTIQVRPTESTNILTFSGGTGEIGEILVTHPVRTEVVNGTVRSVVNNTEYTVEMGTLEVEYSLRKIAYLPRNGGVVLISNTATYLKAEQQSSEQVTESLRNAATFVNDTYLETDDNPGSRKRSADAEEDRFAGNFRGRDTHQAIIHGGIFFDTLSKANSFARFMSQQEIKTHQRLRRAEKRGRRDQVMSQMTETRREKLLRLLKKPNLELGEGNPDDVYHIAHLGMEGYRRLEDLSHAELLTARLVKSAQDLQQVRVEEAKRDALRVVLKTLRKLRSIRQEVGVSEAEYFSADLTAINNTATTNPQRKRFSDLLVGIAGTAAANTVGSKILGEVGGACEALKKGSGFIPGGTDVCLISAVAHLDDQIDGVKDLVELNNQRINEVETGLGQVRDSLSILGDITQNLQTQTDLQQDQIDILRDQQADNLYRFADVARVQNEQAFALSKLAFADLQLQAATVSTGLVAEANFKKVSDRFVGLSESVENTVSEMQSQARALERRANANLDATVRQIFSDMAVVYKDLTNQIGRLALDTNVRLNQLTADVNDMLQQQVKENKIQASLIKQMNEMLTSLTRSVNDLYAHELASGDMAVQYYYYKYVVEGLEGGDTYKALVKEGTGIHPPDMSNYHQRFGLTLNFTYVDRDVCQLTEAESIEVNDAIIDALTHNATVRVYLPHTVNPAYLQYTDPATILSSYRYFHLRASVGVQDDDAFIIHNLLMVPPAMGSTVPLWVYDTPANRAATNRLVCIFVRRDANAPLTGVLREKQLARIRCSYGGGFYNLRFEPVGNTTETYLSFTSDALPPQGPPNNVDTDLYVRHDCRGLTLGECKGRFLQEDPFNSTSSFILTRSHITPLDLIKERPNVITKVVIPATSLPSGINASPLTLFAWGASRDLDPPLAELNWEETDSQTVSTGNFDDIIQQYKDRATIVGSSVYRKRRDNLINNIPPAEQTNTLVNCYEPLDQILATTFSGYNGMPPLLKSKANTCLAKPGCMYVGTSAPGYAVSYNGAGFTGNRLIHRESSSITYSTNLKGVIIPPSINITAATKSTYGYGNCKYEFRRCKFYLQIPICEKLSTIRDEYGTGALDNFWQKANIPDFNGLLSNYRWYVDKDDSVYKSLIETDRTNSGGDCLSSNALTKYTPFGMLRVNNARVFPWVSTEVGCQSENFFSGIFTEFNLPSPYSGLYDNLISRLDTRPGGSWYASKPLANQYQKQPLFSNLVKNFRPIYAGFLDPDRKCHECQEGYGVFQGGKYKPVDGVCNVGLLDGVPPYGNGSAIFFWEDSAQETKYPRGVRLAQAGNQEWYSCQPQVDSVTTSNAWGGSRFPYFFDQSENSPPGVTFDATDALQVRHVYRRCNILSVSTCSFTRYQGLCNVQVDAAATAENNVNFQPTNWADLKSGCGFQADDVCASLTNEVACIRAVDANYPLVPKCMWESRPVSNTVPNTLVCKALDKDLGILSHPTTETGSSQGISFPCAVRDSTLSWKCNHDSNCMHVQHLTNSGLNRCVNMNSGIMTDLQNWLNSQGNYPVTVSSMVQSRMGITSDQAIQCMNPNFYCHIKGGGRFSVALQNLLTIFYMGGGSSVSSVLSWQEYDNVLNSCQNYGPGTGCGRRMVFRSPSVENWHRSRLLPVQAKEVSDERLISGCYAEGDKCRPMCAMYAYNFEKCLGTDANQACFVDQTPEFLARRDPTRNGNGNAICHSNTPIVRDTVCRGITNREPFDYRNNCVNRGNACQLVSADRNLIGSDYLSFDLNTTDPEVNSVLLRGSECARVLGAATGNFTITDHFTDAESARLKRYTLPAFLERRCTAYLDPQGEAWCYLDDDIGACTGDDVCNTLNDPLKSLEAILNDEYCAHVILEDCILATRNGIDFGCVWVESAGTTGFCRRVAEAQQLLSYNNDGNQNVRLITRDTYLQAGFSVGTALEVTISELASLGIGIGQVVFEGSPPISPNTTQVRALTGLKIPCPDRWLNSGDGCCVDVECTQWRPNPNHPRQVYIRETKRRCHVDPPRILSSVSYACKSRPSLLPEDEGGSVYSCEAFVPHDALNFFDLADPGERAREKVEISHHLYSNLYPLHRPVIGQRFVSWRELAPHRTVQFLNTIYEFDSTFDVSAITNHQSLSGSGWTDRRIRMKATNFTDPVTEEVYHRERVMASQTLLPVIDSHIHLYVTNRRTIHGETPQVWETVEDFGTHRARKPHSSAASGRSSSKTEELAFAYLTPDFTVPVWIITDVRTLHTGFLRNKADGTILRPANIQVNNPYSNLLFNIGDRFIHHRENGRIYGVGSMDLGLGEMDKVGYVYSVKPVTHFDTAAYLAANPLFDPRKFRRHPNDYSTEILEDAEEGSPQYHCGLNYRELVNDTDSAQVRQILFELTYSFDQLQAEEQALWSARLETFGADRLLELSDEFSVIWGEVGCPNALVNYLEPGQGDDWYEQWWGVGVDDLTSQINDRDAIEERMRSIFNSRNRYQCGNCLVVRDSSGQLVDSVQGVDVCDPQFIYFQAGEPVLLLPPPKAFQLDIIKTTSLPLCYRSSYYRILLDDHGETGTLKFSLRPGLGQVSMGFRTLPVSAVYQYTATSICPVTRDIEPEPIAGFKILRMENPYNLAASFQVRVRNNATSLATSFLPENGDLCERNVGGSLGNLVNATIQVQVCSSQDYFIQVYNLDGQPCSPVFEGNLDYTAVLANLSANFFFQASEFESALAEGSRLLTANLEELKRATEAAQQATEQDLAVISQTLTDSQVDLNTFREEVESLQLADSLFRVENNITFLTDSALGLITRLNNQTSVIEDLSGRILQSEISFTTVNQNLTDLSTTVNIINEVLNNTLRTTDDILSGVNEGFKALENVTLMGDEVRRLSEENTKLFADLDAKIAALNDTLDRLDYLGDLFTAGSNGLNKLETEARKNNRIIMILTIVLGTVFGLVALGVGIYFLLQYRAKQKLAEKVTNTYKGRIPRTYSPLPLQPPQYYPPQPPTNMYPPPGFPTGYPPQPQGYPQY